jgi:heme/copper-type cytochrome/quinol oxidase subunit 3
MAASAANNRAGTSRPWPQLLALVFGAVYLLVGIVGFFVTGFDDFASSHQHEMLLFFMINPLHNIVHIVIGLAGLLLARSLAGARTYGWLLAVGYAAAFLYGLFAVGESWDFLNINAADNVLHLLTALVGLVIALGPVRSAVGHRASAA